MNICSTMLCFIMSDKKFLKEARNVFKEIQKDLISPEEEEIFKKVAERLNVSYETDKIEENKKGILLKSLATPLLAPMVEEGYFNNKISHDLIEESSVVGDHQQCWFIQLEKSS